MSLLRRYEVNSILKMTRFPLSFSTTNVNDKEFRVLRLIPDQNKTINKSQVSVKQDPAVPEIKKVTDNRDWQAVWPVARTYHPDIVPLPLRQGYKNSKGVHPSKYANAELMKIPNFLHLTPPVIERHCEALKKFCTKWPTELTSSQCAKYFPIEIITSDYCYSSPTIREPLARIVSLRVKLSSLHLNVHAEDKILRLLGDRYDPQTNKITIIADRCPTRKQNLDYVKYLLTALFHISWRVEPWENEICEKDMKYYDWNKSKSKESLTSIYSWPKNATDVNYEHIPHVDEYKNAISNLINEEENLDSINTYKTAVKKVLNLNL